MHVVQKMLLNDIKYGEINVLILAFAIIFYIEIFASHKMILLQKDLIY